MKRFVVSAACAVASGTVILLGPVSSAGAEQLHGRPTTAGAAGRVGVLVALTCSVVRVPTDEGENHAYTAAIRVAPGLDAGREGFDATIRYADGTVAGFWDSRRGWMRVGTTFWADPVDVGVGYPPPPITLAFERGPHGTPTVSAGRLRACGAVMTRRYLASKEAVDRTTSMLTFR